MQTIVATILIVDDNVELATGLAEWLRGPGRKLLMAHDGDTALEVARDHVPQVIILDIGLPGQSGHELTAALRRHPVMKLSLIIAVSGYGLPERPRALQAGVDHFFVKPANPHKLAELVDRHLH